MKRSIKKTTNDYIYGKLKTYIRKTETDWNYITPTDFYNDYYLKKKVIFY